MQFVKTRISSIYTVLLVIWSVGSNAKYLSLLDQWFEDNCQNFSDWLENAKTLRSIYPEVRAFQFMYELMDSYEQSRCPSIDTLWGADKELRLRNDRHSIVMEKIITIYMDELKPICEQHYDKQIEQLQEKYTKLESRSMKEFRIIHSRIPIESYQSTVFDWLGIFAKLAERDPEFNQIKVGSKDDLATVDKFLELFSKYILKPCIEFREIYGQLFQETVDYAKLASWLSNKFGIEEKYRKKFHLGRSDAYRTSLKISEYCEDYTRKHDKGYLKSFLLEKGWNLSNHKFY